jgi:hypothetical protein
VDPLRLLWLFFILASLEPAAQRYVLEARRRANLEACEEAWLDDDRPDLPLPTGWYIDIGRRRKHPPGQPIERPRMGHVLLSFKQTNVREADVGAQLPARMWCRPNWQRNNE